MEADRARLSLCLMGRFRIVGPDGADMTPKGAKTQGLVALLATAPGMSRSRVWLQDKLWSDRGRAQGAASLRQALTELRRALGPFAAAMRADRRAVSLDPGMFRRDDQTDADASAGEFLEGIDIVDEEFEDWLRQERARLAMLRPDRGAAASDTPAAGDRAGRLAAHGTPGRAPRLLIVSQQPQATQTEAIFADLFVDALARSLSEQFTVEVQRGAEARPEDSAEGVAAAGDPIHVSARAMIQQGVAGLRVTLESGARRRRIWAGHNMTTQPQGAIPIDNDDLQRLVNETIEGYSEALLADYRMQAHRMDATVMGRLAVRKIFSMNPLEYPVADELLDRAFQADCRGVYLAWRVLLRVIRLVERHEVDIAQTVGEAIELAVRALELEPLNSMVLAAASNAAMLVSGDTDAATELARRAIRSNPANPFAWDCLSTAALHHGALEEAHAHALRSQKLAGNTPFKHWYDMGCCLTATVTGRIEDAIRMANASTVVPHFKPPLRYLTVLQATVGRPEASRRAMDRLRLLEPDFSPSRMLDDRNYPVAALRKSTLLRPDLIAAIR